MFPCEHAIPNSTRCGDLTSTRTEQFENVSNNRDLTLHTSFMTFPTTPLQALCTIAVLCNNYHQSQHIISS